jgi:hypothetical protein
MLRRIAPVIAVVALIIAGCTSEDNPNPGATTTTTTQAAPTTTAKPSTTSETSRPTNAPPVTDPVDLRRFHEHPCAALTRAQQQEIGFRKYDPVEPEGANTQFGTCVWLEEPKAGTDDGYGYRLTVSMSGDPLAGAYAESNPHEGVNWVVFEPRQIRGFPAVVRSLTRPDDQCSVVVGTGNGQGIEVDGTITADDPTLCDRFVTAAEWVVDAVRK